VTACQYGPSFKKGFALEYAYNPKPAYFNGVFIDVGGEGHNEECAVDRIILAVLKCTVKKTHCK